MTEGEKRIAAKLKSYASQEAEDFMVRKKVYFEGLEGAFESIAKSFDKFESETVKELKESTKNLKDNEDNVEIILNNVKKTLEYER